VTELKLRVVDESFEVRGSAQARHNKHGQLELDLNDEPVRKIIVAAMDRIHGQTLHEIVADFHPALVLDLRNTIRFDLPGTSREVFLEMISQMHCAYMRAPITWDVNLRGPVQVELELPVRLRHEVIERPDGNLILLVNKSEHVLKLSSMLNVALSSYHANRWEIDQVI